MCYKRHVGEIWISHNNYRCFSLVAASIRSWAPHQLKNIHYTKLRHHVHPYLDNSSYVLIFIFTLGSAISFNSHSETFVTGEWCVCTGWHIHYLLPYEERGPTPKHWLTPEMCFGLKSQTHPLLFSAALQETYTQARKPKTINTPGLIAVFTEKITPRATSVNARVAPTHTITHKNKLEIQTHSDPLLYHLVIKTYWTRHKAVSCQLTPTFLFKERN